MNTRLVVVALLCATFTISEAQPVFGPKRIITSDMNRMREIATADFDQDGWIDVAGVAETGDKVAWFRNQGDETFGPLQLIDNPDAPISLASGDYNGDGWPDLLCGIGQTFDAVVVYPNLGGSFGPAQVLMTGLNDPWSVASADFDADGDEDVIAGGNNLDRVVFIENLGFGSFSAPLIITNDADNLFSVHPGDLNGDGLPDIVVAGQWDNTFSWFESLGSGLLGPEQIIAIGPSGPRYVSTGDLDGDGDIDVIGVSSYDNKVIWMENLGSGASWGAPITISSALNVPISCTASDLDLDGDMDVLAASELNDRVAYWVNDGTGVFSSASYLSTSSNGAQIVMTADLTNNGYPDVINSSIFDNTIAWFENETVSCDQATGLTVLDLNPSGIDITWDTVASAHGYLLRSKVLDGPSYKFQASGIPYKSIDFNFISGLVYEWQVRASCDSINGPWSKKSYFMIPADSCLAAPNDLQAWWQGENNANDGHAAHNGSELGGISYTSGLVGRAFQFDGVDDVIRIPDHADLYPASGSFTIEAWAKPFNDGNNFIFGQWGDTGPWSSNRAFNLQIYPGGSVFFAISDDANQSNASLHQFQSAPGSVARGEWNHIVAVYEQAIGQRRIYVNGELKANRTDPPLVITNSIADFAIGSQASSPTLNDFFFDGLIDELSYYTRALDDAEILDIFRAGSAGKCLADDLALKLNLPEKELRVFPNPSSGAVHIKFGDQQADYLRLFSLSGQLLDEWLVSGMPNLSLNLDLAPGSYLLEASSAEGKRRSLLVLE
jgi:hypothetical protein